jgi:hypothetical protein
MSRSYRTDPEHVQAARRARREKDGTHALPRIIVRPPAPGDWHPVSPSQIRRVLHDLPLELWHGLRRIELRARKLTRQIQPLGQYSPREKRIILYSQPEEMVAPCMSEGMRDLLIKFQATIREENGGYIVSWKNAGWMSFWFCSEVFLHELGHHFRNQYPSKNKLLKGVRANEISAVRLTRRFRRIFFRRLGQKRRKRISQTQS